MMGTKEKDRTCLLHLYIEHVDGEILKGTRYRAQNEVVEEHKGAQRRAEEAEWNRRGRWTEGERGGCQESLCGHKASMLV